MSGSDRCAASVATSASDGYRAAFLAATAFAALGVAVARVAPARTR